MQCRSFEKYVHASEIFTTNVQLIFYKNTFENRTRKFKRTLGGTERACNYGINDVFYKH